ncbi:MAG TPA: cupin domain-containing protein [Smithellaceae bacterium]|nr:cupin domain-containing protein [Smithellaceae bacterium]HPL50914.1 cupin domain-containing protein [Smithellaceae bacterium]
MESFSHEGGSMQEEIRIKDPNAEFYTPEGCFINELSNIDADPEASIARARVLPGRTTRWHRIAGTTERYVLLSGEGKVEVGNIPPQRVGPGDVILIPPDCRQRITNVGSTDLLFLVICTPRFRPEAYEDIDPAPMPPEGVT